MPKYINKFSALHSFPFLCSDSWIAKPHLKVIGSASWQIGLQTGAKSSNHRSRQSVHHRYAMIFEAHRHLNVCCLILIHWPTSEAVCLLKRRKIGCCMCMFVHVCMFSCGLRGRGGGVGEGVHSCTAAALMRKTNSWWLTVPCFKIILAFAPPTGSRGN